MEAQFVTEMMDGFFQNFTDLLQDRHPSVAAPIKNLTTCIQESGHVETLKNLIIDAQMHLMKRSNFTVRGRFCADNTKAIFEIVQCIEMVRTIESEAFLSTLWNTAHFILDEFCASPEPFKYFTFEHDVISDLPEFHKPMEKFVDIVGNDTVISEEHLCLPLRVAEGYEIAAIRTHRIPFHFHGQIAEAYHFFATIAGKFPFKTVQECAF
uniref:Uncharacterized protein n=1 Tax=Panagrolaimus sp. ES5 TaxID=591445 RepID=A0AC34F1J9_9BILA